MAKARSVTTFGVMPSPSWRSVLSRVPVSRSKTMNVVSSIQVLLWKYAYPRVDLNDSAYGTFELELCALCIGQESMHKPANAVEK